MRASSPVRRRRILFENVQAWAFLFPALLALGVFQFFPAFFAFYISLFRWEIVQGPFRGLENYASVLFGAKSETFLSSLGTTLTYVLFTVPFEMAIALGIAVVLFRPLRARGLYRTAYFLPYITSTVAAAVVFTWIFNPNYGLINWILNGVGIPSQRWLDEPRGAIELAAGAFGWTVPDWAAGPSMALLSVCIFTVWHYIGYMVVIFLAGLGSISSEYYEAARIDGATEGQLFRHITLPLLSPTTFFVLIIATVGALKAFNQIYVMTRGGPLDTSRVVSMEIFRTFFQRGDFGVGSAMAFILVGIILLLTLFQFRVVGRRVHYE
jgi:multiple sugar transport system permease protein